MWMKSSIKIVLGGFLQSVHLKRKTEAKLLICQTHGVQLFASWEDVVMLVAKGGGIRIS